MSLAKLRPPVKNIGKPALTSDDVALKRQQFAEKAYWMEHVAKYPPVNPYEYYNQIYHGEVPSLIPIQFADDCEPSTAKADGLFSMFRHSRERQAATALGSFYNGWRSRATLANFYAFVLDIEDVSPHELTVLLDYLAGDFHTAQIMPTYVNLSGGGAHLVFHGIKPVAAYKWRHRYLDGIVRALKNMVAAVWTVDKKCGIVHAVRIVGGLTKHGDSCLAFRTGKQWDFAELAKIFGLSFPEDNPHQMLLFPKEKGEVEKVEPKPASVPRIPKHKPSFWRWSWLRLMNKVAPGNRHMQLFALAVIAYKCHISRDETTQRLQTIIDIYDEKNPHDPMPAGELAKAMGGYSQKWLRVTANTLAEWSGLEFNPRKRNGRTQEQHLKIARASRNARQSVDKQAAIEKYQKKNPSASQREIAEALKMSRKTVAKYAPR